MDNINIFYSWQSDLRRDTNADAIRYCLKKVSNEISRTHGINVNHLEATSNELGSPEIPQSILKNISNSDIFVCDITTIGASGDASKKIPNPNVMLELGYAIAILGWQRIIMLFNTAHGAFQTEAPFDLEKRRIVPFTIKEPDEKNGIGDLVSKLRVQIESIIKKDPTKSFLLLGAEPEKKKRANDIKYITHGFSVINIPILDKFISALPHKVIGEIWPFWHSFDGIMKSSHFYLYDAGARSYFYEMRQVWGQLLSHGDHFSATADGKNHLFHLPGDIFPSDDSQKTFNIMLREAATMKQVFKDLLNYVRENFIEVDLDFLSAKAFDEYSAYQNEQDSKE